MVFVRVESSPCFVDGKIEKGNTPSYVFMRYIFKPVKVLFGKANKDFDWTKDRLRQRQMARFCREPERPRSTDFSAPTILGQIR